MTAFNDLPYETLYGILSHLPGAELARIACLSRRLYDIAQPVLYKAPYLPRAPEIQDPPVTWTSRELFLRTLLTPAGATLAAHVLSLRVEWDSIESKRATEYLSDSLAIRSATASRLHLNYPLWRQGAQLMHIFDLLPRLQTFHIIPANGCPTSSRRSFARFLDRAISPGKLPLALHSLHSFHCAPDSCRRLIKRNKGVTGWTMLMLLQLPSIHTIDVPTFSRRRNSRRFPYAVPAPSHTTRLRFSAADIPPWALAFILLSPIALTHFSYTAAPGGSFKRRAFVNALVPLRTSLRSLHVDFGNASVSPSGDWNQQAPDAAGSLRDWLALRTLSCALVMLLGAGPWVVGLRLVEVLPVGIRELEVLPDRYWSVEERVGQLEELLRRKGEVVPVLERVAVEGARESSDMLGKVRGACEAVGVRLVEGVCRW